MAAQAMARLRYAADMSPRATRSKPPPDPSKLVRAGAGRYVTGDARFTVESSSGGWVVEDGEQANELGLALVRGPFATLDLARAAIDAARAGPAPFSDLADRAAAIARLPSGRSTPIPRRSPMSRTTARGAPLPAGAAFDETGGPSAPEPLPLVVREYRSGDGDPLRALWVAAGFRTAGDDDRGLQTFAQRNPGLFLVAVRGNEVVASAMGGWDGRRGWIYHVATAEGERRAGLASQLVRRIEAGLRDLGCRRVSVVVRDGNRDGAAFWTALGYGREARQYARNLEPG